MTATVEATYTSVQGDGLGNGQAFATGTEVDTGDWLITATACSGNGTTITAPGTGTWAQITLPDNVITTSGGQIRLWKCSNPADSTTYTWSFTSSRQSLVAALVGGADGTDAVDVASSLETAVGTSHNAPSVTPGGASYLVLDFVFHRQFSPDTTNWSVPASGLTWSELQDVQGADGNNNVRLALGSAIAGSGGVAISTSPWTKTDANEEGMVCRVVIKSAAAGGNPETGRAVLGLAGTGRAVRVAGTGGRAVFGLAGGGVDRRVAGSGGRVPLALAARAVEARRAATAGAAVLGLTGRAVEAQGTPSENGRGVIGLTGYGRAVRVASTGGRASLGLAGAGASTRRAGEAGRTPLALTGAGRQSQPGAQVGTPTGSASTPSGLLSGGTGLAGAVAGGVGLSGTVVGSGSATLFA